MQSSSCLLICLLALLAAQSVYGFLLRISQLATRPLILSSQRLVLKAASDSTLSALLSSVPPQPKSRVKLQLKGASVGTAQFRADLKKELTFYRGCAATLQIAATASEATLTTEGKTASLLKFFDWLGVLELPAAERKANFQGPSLVVTAGAGQWMDFVGDLKGFSSPDQEAPPLDGTGLGSCLHAFLSRSRSSRLSLSVYSFLSSVCYILSHLKLYITFQLSYPIPRFLISLISSILSSSSGMRAIDAAAGEKTLEGQSMAGTDESV